MTKRDRRVLRFIEDFHCATTKQIKTLFFPNVSIQRCCQRLKLLVEHDKVLKRERAHIDEGYLYYVTKPKQIEHCLTRADAYIWMKPDLYEFIPEFKRQGFRADAYAEIWKDGMQSVFMEIQLSPGFDQDKYETYYRIGEWKERWNVFPSVWVIANRNIKLSKSKVEYTIIPIERVCEK